VDKSVKAISFPFASVVLTVCDVCDVVVLVDLVAGGEVVDGEVMGALLVEDEGVVVAVVTGFLKINGW